MGAVRRTRDPVHLRVGPAVPLTFVPLVEMLHLHGDFAAEGREYGCAVWREQTDEKTVKVVVNKNKERKMRLIK